MAPPRMSAAARIRAWLRLAYTELDSREHRVLLEWVISLVIISVVSTVLQHDPALDEAHHTGFVVVEELVLACFVVDFLFNVYFSPKRWRYALTTWGVVDILAILPSVLLITNFSTLKILRGLRFLRFIRVLKVAKVAQRRSVLEEEERHSSFFDLQMSVIVISGALLLVPSDGLRDLLLSFVLCAAATIGIRRWLVAHQHPTFAVVILMASLLASVLYAVSLDGDDHAYRAAGLVVLSAMVALLSWLRVEMPAGGL